ncbi:MAG: YhbY family RNA-binding protein [Candidatus Hodarchaeales archaeon]|jgi:RNA-binding protein YhbY
MSKIHQPNLRNIRSESPSLQVGKNGLSDSFLIELDTRLKKEGTVKIKFLKNSPYSSRQEAILALKGVLNSKFELIETRGWTATLHKKS